MRANSACLQALLQHIIVSHCDYDNQQHLESFLSWPWLCGSIFVTFIVIFYLCSFRLDGETCQFLFLFPFPLVHLQFVHYAYVLFCAEFFCAHLIMLKNHFILFRVICLFQYLDFSSVTTATAPKPRTCSVFVLYPFFSHLALHSHQVCMIDAVIHDAWSFVLTLKVMWLELACSSTYGARVRKEWESSSGMRIKFWNAVVFLSEVVCPSPKLGQTANQSGQFGGKSVFESSQLYQRGLRGRHATFL